MRFILWLGLILAVLWGGYWFVGSTVIERAAGQWIANSAEQGLATEHEGLSVSGFPSRFDLTVDKPKLTQLASGWGWSAPFVQVLAMTWKPWHVIAALPGDQEIIAPGQRIALTTSKMAASFRVQPRAALTFEELVIEGHDLEAKSDLGWQIAARSAVLALARDRATPFGQHLGLDILDLRPDPALTALVPDLGAVITRAHLDANLALSGALDRHMAEKPLRMEGLAVNDLQINWGKLKLGAKGEVALAADGTPVGEIVFRVENWQQVPILLVALGVVRPEMAERLTKTIDILAQSGVDPDVLQLPLTFADGWMTLGPVPLGPSPVFN
jgi:hypothetical protein